MPSFSIHYTCTDYSSSSEVCTIKTLFIRLDVHEDGLELEHKFTCLKYIIVEALIEKCEVSFG